MIKRTNIRVSTNVRRVGRGIYQVRTTASNGSKTRTIAKTIRVR